MYRRGNKEFILDMFLACQKILEYTEGLSFEEFAADNKTLDAVIRNIEILGNTWRSRKKHFKRFYEEISKCRME